jgi:4-hydroxybenzoate polyprenyltransferase
MFRFAEVRKILLGVLVTLGFVAAGLVALFVMLWLALIAILGFFLYAAVRRMLPRKRKRRPGPGGGSEVIEGEFRIERNDRKP